MITRRTFVCVAATGLLAIASQGAFADPATANDPVAIVNAIYTRVSKGKGDGGGGFVIENKAAKAKYLSKSLIALWAKADARTPKGDVGPVDFDPVTNSQDPLVKSFTVKAEKSEAAIAVIAVTLVGYARSHAADSVVRFDFVLDGGQWKIDDIRGAVDGKPWSIRGLLKESLKT